MQIVLDRSLNYRYQRGKVMGQHVGVVWYVHQGSAMRNSVLLCRLLVGDNHPLYGVTSALGVTSWLGSNAELSAYNWVGHTQLFALTWGVRGIPIPVHVQGVAAVTAYCQDLCVKLNAYTQLYVIHEAPDANMRGE